MRNSLYNPFMPSLLFKDRVVYGGGGGGGGEAAPAPEPEPTVEPEKFTSTFPELKGQEYNTQEEVNSAEKKILEERRIKEEGETAKKEADEYATSTSADLDAASKKVRDKIVKLNLELQQLLQKDQTNPDIKAAVEAKRKEIGVAQEEAAAIGQGQGAQLSGAQQEMVKKSLTDPGSLAKKGITAEAVDKQIQLVKAATEMTKRGMPVPKGWLESASKLSGYPTSTLKNMGVVSAQLAPEQEEQRILQRQRQQ